MELTMTRASLRKRLAAVVLGALAVGCSLVPEFGTRVTDAGSASLSLLPDIKGGGFRTQALLTAYASPDINHLTLKLFKVAGGSEQAVLDPGGQPIAVDVPQAGLDGRLVVGNLAFETTYRVKACAYASAGTANLISTSDSRSWVEVAIARDDRPVLATVPVQLIDRVFGGEATASGFAVSPGILVHTGSESFAAAPTPTP
jgi:hypothetical protein